MVGEDKNEPSDPITFNAKNVPPSCSPIINRGGNLNLEIFLP